MRRAFVVLSWAVAALAVGGCGAGGQADRAIGHGAHVYVDPQGWAIDVPREWHLVSFNEYRGGVSSSGVLISNVRLPEPSLDPGSLVQVDGDVLPARGIGLVIASDTDPGLASGFAGVLPLPAPDKWDVGSAPAGQPYLESTWFRVGGRLFVADAKIGANAARTDLAALKWIAGTLRAH